MRRWTVLLALLLAPPAWAEGKPLTLDEVLAYADAPHPQLDKALAQREAAEAELALADSFNDVRLNLEGTLRTGRNPVFRDKFKDDNGVRLNLRKTLLDGGRSEATIAADRLDVQARDLQLLDTRAQRRIGLMSRFFDVLLSDLRYAADNEFMATDYVTWDDSRDRQRLGMLSTADMAALEAAYNESRIRRNDADRRVREKRLKLAAAMNRPNDLPNDVADPDLASNNRPLPEFEPLLAAMEQGNPLLKAQRQMLDAAQHRLTAIRAEDLPSVEFEAEAATWSRETATRDDLRAGFNVVWPLYQGKRVDARMAKEQAQFHLLQAQYEQMRLDMREALYETWQAIQYLRDTERPAAMVHAALRDAQLEKARAVYELEIKARLGPAMAETQAALWRKRAVEYQLALTWARLEALVGSPIDASWGKAK